MDVIKVLEGRQEYLKALAKKEQKQEAGSIPERVAQARLSEISTLLYVLRDSEEVKE